MINRSKPLKNSRYKKIRLDKNEKNDAFEKFFLSSFTKSIKSYHLSSYQETYDVYKNISSIKNHALFLKLNVPIGVSEVKKEEIKEVKNQKQKEKEKKKKSKKQKN